MTCEAWLWECGVSGRWGGEADRWPEVGPRKTTAPVIQEGSSQHLLGFWGSHYCLTDLQITFGLQIRTSSMGPSAVLTTSEGTRPAWPWESSHFPGHAQISNKLGTDLKSEERMILKSIFIREKGLPFLLFLFLEGFVSRLGFKCTVGVLTVLLKQGSLNS